jgi:secreted trypsin-like serine protease
MQTFWCISALLLGCALAMPGKPRIIGGDDAAPHSHPWQASLQLRQYRQYYHICGASVINSNWLLTAAHCVEGQSRSSLRIVLGDHDFTLTENSEATYSIDKIIMHAKYNDAREPGVFPHDIALIKVTGSIAMSSKTSAIQLAEEGMDFYGNRNCKISGWGLVDSGRTGTTDTDILQEIQADIKSQQECRNSWDSSSITDGHICVNDGNNGACNGDSGGPLSCEVNGQMYLAGVTSWGYSGCRTAGYPSVYTRVSQYKRWIEENMARY